MEKIKASLPFYHVTGTPHTGLGTICVHYWATINSKENIQKTVESSGANSLLVSDYFGNSALHYAASSDALNVAKYIISLLPNARFINNKNVTPAHIAAQRNNVEMLKEFQKSPSLLTDASKKGWTPFHYAVYYGSYDSVEFLLQTGKVNINQLILGAETFQKSFSSKHALRYFSPLDLAIYAQESIRNNTFEVETHKSIENENENVDETYNSIIKLLIKNYALPSLHAAVRLNNLPAIGYHLFSPFSPFKGKLDTLSQYRKSSPLHIAAALGNYQVCHSLLQRGCSTDLVDGKGFCPLELSVIADSIETVLVLIPHSSPEQIAKATFIAADLTHQTILETLLKTKELPPSAIDKENNSMDSILIRLIKRKMYKTACEFLNDKIGQIDVSYKDSEGATALHYACASGNSNLITLLLQSISSHEIIEAKDNEGMTPLFYAVRYGVNILQILKKSDQDQDSSKAINMFTKYSNVDVINKYGLSPIVYGICFGLMTKIIPTSKSREMKFTVDLFKLANGTKNAKVTRMFPDYKSNSELTCICPRIALYGPQYIQAINCNPVRLFIEKMKTSKERRKRFSNYDDKTNFNDNTTTNAEYSKGGKNHKEIGSCIVPGASLLHLSIIFEARSGVIKGFLDSCSPEENIIDKEDDKGRTPIMYAVMLRRTNIISMLISYNAKITNRDKDGNSIYHYIDDPSVFDSLREAMRNLNLSELACIPNNSGELPIHTACRAGCLPVLKQLVSLMHEQDPSLAKDSSFLYTKNNHNKTPLDIAFRYKNFDCLEFLHSQGVPNLLVEAVRKNDIDKVKDYVRNGYPINSFDKDHVTPLHAAAIIQSAEIIKYLIRHGAEPKVQMLDGSLPIHFAASHNNIDICMLLFTDKFKISSIHSSVQPFLSATDEKCRYFLYHYWKREILSKCLIKYIKRFNNIFQGALDEVTQIMIKMEKHKVNLHFIQSFISLISQIMFISERILMRRTSQPLPFSYRYSLHHLFQVLTTLNMSNYCEKLEEKLKQFHEDLRQVKIQLSKIIYIFIIPIFWIDSVSTFLSMLKVHLLENVDNEKLFGEIISCINQQREKVLKYKSLGIPKEDDSALSLLSKNQGGNDTGSNQSLGTSQKQDSELNIATPLNTKENVIVICEGKVEEIHKKPLCIFNPQFFDGLKEYFGPSFVIPRTIPFRNREQIKVALCEDSISFIGRSSSLRIPLFFTYIKHYKQSNEITFTLPIGEFKFLSSHNDTILNILNVSILHRSQLVHRFEHGVLSLQRNKDRIFKCLTAFKLSGERVVHLKFIVVRAGSKEACYDVCQQHLFDLLPHPPIFFNVSARDVTSELNM